VLYSVTKSSDWKLPDRKNDEAMCNALAEFLEEKKNIVGITPNDNINIW